MMRGFLRGFTAGTMTLVVIYVVVQPGTATKIGLGGNIVVASLRSWGDPGRAGIGNHTQPTTQNTLTNPPPTSGGGGVPKYT
jgi:hypothetical protein